MSDWRVTVLLLAACVPARAAELAVFDLGPGRANTQVVSADGYHYATHRIEGDKAQWLVDGKVVAEGPAGTMPINSRNGSRYADLTADGRILISVSRLAAGGDSPKFTLVANGKPIGRAYDSVSDVQVSPRGANAVFLATIRGKGCFVVSGAGEGPAFPECPEKVRVSDQGVVYMAKWQNDMVIYRDLNPVSQKDYRDLVASPDLSRIAARLDDGKAYHTVEMGDTVVARYPSIHEMFFSADGKHFAVIAGENQKNPDKVVVDGKPFPASGSFFRLMLRPGDGVPHWVSDAHYFVGGTDKGRLGYETGRADRWLGFSPSGKHSAFVTHDETGTPRFSRLIADGISDKDAVPKVMDDGGVVFDNENEFHYIGWRTSDDRLRLVCGTIDGSPPKKTPCGRIGAARAVPVSE